MALAFSRLAARRLATRTSESHSIPAAVFLAGRHRAFDGCGSDTSAFPCWATPPASASHRKLSSTMSDHSVAADVVEPVTSRQPTSDDEEKAEEWTNYERLVRKLYMTNLFNPVKLGLENMDKLHGSIGSPMDRSDIAVVHVAGSNGKGSVALKTANALHCCGYKVGLFVSPHISSFRERVQINGQPISEVQVEQHLQKIFDLCEQEDIPATFFEITTALAFHVFGEESVDVVVLETGLGGRLDATNVIKQPALSIITSIALEHTRILGDTVEKIALEKGGIIKEGCPVLFGDNLPLGVLQQCAREKNASAHYRLEDMLGKIDEPAMIHGDESFEDYDVQNSRIATAGLMLIEPRLSKLRGDEAADKVKLGVSIRPPCRFEELDVTAKSRHDGEESSQPKSTKVILDVAHNPQAMHYLIAKLNAKFPKDLKKRIVVGMSADKDLKYCTDILLDHVSDARALHLVEASHPRAASISSILDANPKLIHSHYTKPCKDELNRDGRDETSVSTQVRKALDLAARNDEIVIICGSVFIMADAREELGIIEPRDSRVIAEVSGAGMRSSQENFGSSSSSTR